MLKVNTLLIFLVIASGSVYGQSDTTSSVNINTQASLQHSNSKLVATSADKVRKSKSGNKQVSRLLQDYIQQLIREKPEIEGCMEG